MKTIGQQLKKARINRNLTIQDVVKATHIRARYLEALEGDSFEIFTSPAQIRGFLINYAGFLGVQINPDPFTTENEAQKQNNLSSEESANSEASNNEVINNDPRHENPEERILNSGNHEIKIPSKPSISQVIKRVMGKFKKGNRVMVADNSEDRPTIKKIDEKNKLPSFDSKNIFQSIGISLNQRRELLGLSLTEIEQHTRVRKHYLEKIERGDFGELPSSVQARGMISNYAHFLDMDADSLLLQFADGLQMAREERLLKNGDENAGKLKDTPSPSFFTRILTTEVIILGIFMFVFIALIAWGASKLFYEPPNDLLQATAPSISEMLLITPTSETLNASGIPETENTNIPDSPDIMVVSTTSNELQGPINIIVISLERAYVIVTIDGQVKFNGRVIPDTAYPYYGEQSIEVSASNGAAIKIIYNGVDMGLMGNRGQVVNYIYSINSISTPTASVTPTATATLTPTITPKPSTTSRITDTPLP